MKTPGPSDDSNEQKREIISTARKPSRGPDKNIKTRPPPHQEPKKARGPYDSGAQDDDSITITRR